MNWEGWLFHYIEEQTEVTGEIRGRPRLRPHLHPALVRPEGMVGNGGLCFPVAAPEVSEAAFCAWCLSPTTLIR